MYLPVNGIDNQPQRTVIIADLIPNPDNLNSLLDETKEVIEDTCASYAKLPLEERFHLSRVVIKRLIGLMFWAKDQQRLSLPVSMPNRTSQEILSAMILSSAARNGLRISQKKISESLITSSFDTKLKNRSQWERWCTELKALLNAIVGPRGVALAYVIRNTAVTAPETFASYEDQALWICPHAGMKFELDRKAVHNIIIRNIAENSDAYIYLKPSINRENGAEDMRLLRE